MDVNFQIKDFPVREPFPNAEADKVANLVFDTVHTTAKANRGDAYDVNKVIWHKMDELRMLYDLASGKYDTPETAGYVFQGGIFCGGSACVMARALKDANHNYKPIVAVDVYAHGSKRREPNDEARTALVESHINVQKLELSDWLYLVWGTNQIVLSKLLAIPLRMAFLDSSHGYLSTLEETRALIKHMAPHGYIVFHDYWSPDWGVGKAVNETFNAYTDRRFWVYNFRNRFLIVKFDTEF